MESVARGDEAELRLAESAARSPHSRLDAAGRFGHRDLPAFAGARGDPHLADHHGHRQARRIGAGARPRGRRGRLCRQAVFGDRIDGPRARAAPTQPAGAGRRATLRRRSRSRSARPGASGAAIATFALARPIFGCSNICSKSRAGCSRGRNCSIWCGGARRRSTNARSTCTSGACARNSRKGRERDPIRTVRGAGYAIDESFGGSDWR